MVQVDPNKTDEPNQFDFIRLLSSFICFKKLHKSYDLYGWMKGRILHCTLPGLTK